MRRRAMTLAACAAALAIPVAGASAANEDPAGQGNSATAKQCAAEKKADKAAFKATYGKHAMRNCLKGTVAETVEEFESAADACRAQRDADEAAFIEQWGTNAPAGENANGAKRNAFGKCVSATAKTLGEDAEEAPAEEPPTA